MEALGRSVEDVDGPEALLSFVERLMSTDKIINTRSTAQYFDQLSGFLGDSTEGYLARYSHLPPEAWKLVADILWSGAIYD